MLRTKCKNRKNVVTPEQFDAQGNFEFLIAKEQYLPTISQT